MNSGKAENIGNNVVIFFCRVLLHGVDNRLLKYERILQHFLQQFKSGIESRPIRLVCRMVANTYCTCIGEEKFFFFLKTFKARLIQ